ncbi:MAG: nucleotide pyrophosphatase, partial [Acidimicrobiales bacterium]|nr:nucleotide pyrophosphatase [Acidimicrobiales bacterium]
ALLTGIHSGHHGGLYNSWWDKDLNEQIVTESPSTWHLSMQWLRNNVETLHEAIWRQNPDATTVSINEPADRGATYSTFDLWRRGAMSALGDLLPKDEALPEFASERWYRENKEYSWASIADHLSMSQAIEIFSGSFGGRDFTFPELSWINFALTDAAFHSGGPDSEIGYGALIDTDKRLGRVLEALHDSGKFEKSAVLVVADHGMEETNPEVQGDWEKDLKDRGFKVRDESFGFLYLEE